MKNELKSVNFNRPSFCPNYNNGKCKNQMQANPDVTCEYEIDLDTCDKLQQRYTYIHQLFKETDTNEFIKHALNYLRGKEN